MGHPAAWVSQTAWVEKQIPACAGMTKIILRNDNYTGGMQLARGRHALNHGADVFGGPEDVFFFDDEGWG